MKLVSALFCTLVLTTQLHAQTKRPNILMIMTDDVGVWNVGAYSHGMMVGRIDDDDGNGFAWHTTGSGKTLTSFKASTLLKDNPDLVKCLFVVDTAMRDSAFGKCEAIPQVVSAEKDNMVALPGQFFYSTQIPVCLWLLAKNKNADAKRGFRERRGQYPR